jgi:hypothetical protein
MKHPLHFIHPTWRRYFFWTLFGLTFAVVLGFGITGAPINTDAAPYGIVSYELAGNEHRAEEILASWNSIARERVAFSLGFDFLFIPLYAFTIAFGCSLASDALRLRGWPLVSLGGTLAWSVFLAGFLDTIENIVLLIILFNKAASPWPQIALGCAVPKFVFVFLGIVYVLLGLVVSWVKPEE